MKKRKVYDSVAILLFALIVLGILAIESKSVSAMLTAVAAIFSFWKYVDTRDRELAWRHTEFLFHQAEYLDKDKDIAAAVRVMMGADPSLSVDDLFVGSKLLVNEANNEHYRYGFEKLLNLLDRLAYAHLRKETLSMDELANFKWYFSQVCDNHKLTEYCNKNGFSDVVKMAEEVKGAKC